MSLRILDIVLNNTLVIALVVELCATILAFSGKISADDWMKVTFIILGYSGGVAVGRASVEWAKPKNP